MGRERLPEWPPWTMFRAPGSSIVPLGLGGVILALALAARPDVTAVAGALDRSVVTAAPLRADGPVRVRVSVRPAEHRPETRAFEIDVLGRLLEPIGRRAGLAFEFSAPDSIAEQLARIADEEADLFALSPFTYLVARERHGVEPCLAALKRGQSPFYVAELVADRTRGVDCLEDLRGRTVALDAEAHSNPVRYWLGHDLLARAGLLSPLPRSGASAVRPLLDPALDRYALVEAVLDGRADAAVSFWASRGGAPRDARWFHEAEHPGARERLTVVALSEGVPYPVLAFRRGFDAARARRFTETTLEFLASPEGRAFVRANLLCHGSEGLGPVRDADFDALRRLVERNGLDVEALLEHDDDTY